MCPVSYNIKSTRQKLDGTLKKFYLFSFDLQLRTHTANLSNKPTYRSESFIKAFTKIRGVSRTKVLQNAPHMKCADLNAKDYTILRPDSYYFFIHQKMRTHTANH